MHRDVARHRLACMADDMEIFNITNAPKALTADQASRQRRYFISMMIRTICFVLTVLLPSPYRWIALFGAIALPYFAVVIANAGRENIVGGSNLHDDNPRALS